MIGLYPKNPKAQVRELLENTHSLQNSGERIELNYARISLFKCEYPR
jgi:hypothetical protein